MESLTPANMKRSELPFFEGRENVTCFTSDAGIKIYLTKPIPLRDIAIRNGGCKLNTIETDVKHELFIFDNNDKEVGRYYLGKKLQGKSPKELTELLDILVVFDSYNTNTKQWVPCVGYLEKTEEATKRLLKAGLNAYENNKKLQSQKENKHAQQKQNSVKNHQQYNYGKESQEREKLIEKKKQEDRANSNFFFFFIVAGLIIYMVMGGIARCLGVKGDPFDDCGVEWQYKHTDSHY